MWQPATCAAHVDNDVGGSTERRWQDMIFVRGRQSSAAAVVVAAGWCPCVQFSSLQVGNCIVCWRVHKVCVLAAVLFLWFSEQLDVEAYTVIGIRRYTSLSQLGTTPPSHHPLPWAAQLVSIVTSAQVTGGFYDKLLCPAVVELHSGQGMRMCQKLSPPSHIS